jgi:antibiotic biosynthesis monooxygenase (ABM) superfamily enzyme
MDPNATPATELPRVELGAQASAVDQAMATANRPTRLEATPTPPREHTRQASGSSGNSTGDSQQHSGRPRAKLALLTWAGAYALILLVLTVGGPAMASWPVALRALVLSGLMVAAMTWVIVPVTTRLLRGWLQR